MPRMDGIEATQRLTEAHPNSVAVLVSIEDVHDLEGKGTPNSCGAVAFLHKQELRGAVAQSRAGAGLLGFDDNAGSLGVEAG